MDLVPEAVGSVFLPVGALDMGAQGGPQLVGSECTECHQKVFPSAKICPGCISEQIRPVLLSREGNLYSYSVVHIAPKGWQGPYVIGYVDLPEDVRVLAHIVGVEPKDVHCDMQVRLCVGAIRTNENGQPVISYQFTPIAKEG